MAPATQTRSDAVLVRGEPDPRELSATVAWLAALMDDAYEIPGTNYRIGLDAIIGLIPGIGDLAGMLIGSVILKEAQRLGVSRWTQARMMANYGIDFLVGLVPLAGDLFDIGFKAHRKNLRLLQKHLDKRNP
jgi:uncharacterized protein DUF4112